MGLGQNLLNTPTLLSAAYVPAFTPEAYGAKGDGTTLDTAALTSMFAAACAAGAGSSVYLAKTYLVGGSGTIFTLTAGLRFRGKGKIKVQNANGPWTTIIGGGANDLSGLDVGEVTLDGNNTNNPLVAGDISGNNLIAGHERQAIVAGTGNGMKVIGCTFNDFDSEWVVNLSGSNVKVKDNTFTRIGNTTSSLFHDHSTIYIDAADGIEVSGNTISSVAPGVTTAPINYGAISAIECHGSTQRVHDNAVIGYCLVGQLSASATNGGSDIDWHDNIGFSVGHGISLVPQTAVGFTNTKVHHNIFDIDFLTWRAHPFVAGGMGVSFNESGTAPNAGVDISENTVYFRPGTYTGQTEAPGAVSTGVTYWRQDAGHTVKDTDIRISRNRIVGAPDPGLYILPDLVNGLEVVGNRIINANAAANASGAYSMGVIIVPYGAVSNVRIDDNEVIDSQTASNSPYGNTAHTLAQGYYFQTTAAWSKAKARDNRMHIDDGGVVAFAVTSNTGLTFDPPLLTSGGYYVPGRATAAAAAANGAGQASFAPLRLGYGTVVELGCEVITLAASSSVRMGLYADNNGRPGVLVLDAGTVASTTTGVKAITVSAPIEAGVYWLCVVPQGGSPSLRVMDTGQANPLLAFTAQDALAGAGETSLYAVGITGALPATAPSMADYTAGYAAYVKAA